MSDKRKFVAGVATLTGYVIGAGVLGIPFVAVRSGFWTTMLILLVLGLVMTLLNLMMGEVSLRSKVCHQLVGYANKYLGSAGKWWMTAAMLIGGYGGMTAYTIGVSNSFVALFGGNSWVYILLFYVIMGWLIHGGLRTLGASEIWLEALLFTVFAVAMGVLYSSSSFALAKLSGFSLNRLMLPFGVILFAVMGSAAIPEVRAQTLTCSKFTKKIIILGSLLPVALYALFTAAVVGVSGGSTTQVATIGLASFTGIVGTVLLHLFAIFAMTSTFVVVGFVLKETFYRDFKLSYFESWALTMAIPLLAIILGVNGFAKTLDISGAFAGGITSILIVAIHSKAKRKAEREPEYTVKLNNFWYFLLVVLFAIGILYQLVIFL